MYRDYFLPIGLLAGAIIGAGVFALPFVFHSAGLSVGFFYLALGALAYSLVHLLYADVILRTDGEHRFVGYARMYLGRLGGWLSVFSAVIEMVIVLAVYLILSKSFGELIIPGRGMEALFAFWFFGSLGIFINVRRLATLEFWITGGMVAIIAGLFALSFHDWGNITLSIFYPHAGLLLLPFAPVLFALSGRVAVPSVIGYFRGVYPRSVLWYTKLSRVLCLGTLLPAIVYGFFVLSIVALSPVVTADAVTGLVGVVSPLALFVVGVFGLLSLFSSYIVVGLDVSNVLRYDLKFVWPLRMAVVVLLPITLYVAGAQNFIQLVSFVGGTFLALEGIFVALMWFCPPRPSLLLPRFGKFWALFVLSIFVCAFILTAL